MVDVTFTFLLIHPDYQDSITYQVNEKLSFEDVISHICSSFDYDRKNVEVRSSLGFEVDDFDIENGEIANLYGVYYKFIVREELPPAIGHDSKSIEYSEQIEKTVSAEPQSQRNQVSTDEIGEEEVLHDVLDDLILINSETWKIADDGTAEVAFFPRVNTSIITQLQVRYHTQDSFKDLIAEVSAICGMLPDDVLLVPLQEDTSIIESFSGELIDFLNQYGAVYIIYHMDKKEQLATQQDQMAEQVRQLIYKYKRRK